MATVNIRASGDGLDGAVLENAATEETLAKLLAAVTKLSGVLGKTGAKPGAGASAKSGDKVSTDGLNKFDSELAASSAELNNSTHSLGIFGKSLDATGGDLTRFAQNTRGAGVSAGNLAKSLSATGGDLTKFAVNVRSTAEKSGDLTKALEEDKGKLNKEFAGAMLDSGIGILGSALSGLISVVGDMVGAGKVFAQSLLNDEVTLSSFANTLSEASSKIPIFGSLLGGLFGVIGSFAKYLESTRDAITKMGESGAAFNDNINAARSAAKAAGVSLEEFASVVTQNAQALSVFGTVTDGAKALGEASKQVRGRLLNMGMSIDQINSELPDAMELFAVGARGQNKSTAELAGSAAGLMTEMDAMARLTGKSRKDQMAALKKQQSSAAYQYKLAGMSQEQQRQINAEMARMQAQFGDAGAELVKARVLGITPMTEEARMMMATMPEAADNINGLTDQIMGSKEGIANFDKQLNKTTVDSVKSAVASGKSLEGVLRAAAAGGGPQAQAVAKNFDVLLQNQKKYLKEGGQIDEKLLLEDIEKATAQQKVTDANLASMNKFEESMRNMKEMIQNKIVNPLLSSGIMEKLQSAFGGIIERISKIDFNAVVDKIKGFLDKVLEKLPDIMNFLEAVFTKAGEIISGFMEEFPKYIPMIEGFIKGVISAGSFLIDHFKAIVISIGAVMLVMGALKGIILVQQALEAARNLGITFSLAPLAAFAAGVWSAVAPFLPLIAIVTAVVAAVYLLYKGFQHLYKNGWTFGQVLEAVGDNLKSVFLNLEDTILGLIQSIGRFLGWDSKWIKTKRESIAKEKHDLAVREAKRDQDRKATAEQRAAEDKELKQKSELTDAEKEQYGITQKQNKEDQKKLEQVAGGKAGETAGRLGLGITGPAPAAGAGGGAGAAAGGGGAVADAKPTSGADLKKMGLKIKEGDVQAPEGSLSPRLVELAKKVQDGIPGFRQITGLNDKWHNENSPSSKHTKGIAMDFVLDHQPSEEEGQKIISMLKGMGANFVIDEYNHPSAKATAGHIHTEVPLQAQKGGIFDGPNTGYPVMLHGKEMITPLNPANLTAGTAQAAQSQIAKATGEGDSNQDTVTALQRLIDIQERSLRTLKTIAENV